MPGPIDACLRSTGAMPPAFNLLRASGNSSLSASTNSRRVAMGALAGRVRHASTMLDARAFAPSATGRLLSSVRIGQVPLMANPASIAAPRKVSQPVLTSPLSPFFLRLLEGVVDSDWKGGIRIVGKTFNCLRHAVEKEILCFLFAAVAEGCGDQLPGLWHG